MHTCVYGRYALGSGLSSCWWGRKHDKHKQQLRRRLARKSVTWFLKLIFRRETSKTSNCFAKNILHQSETPLQNTQPTILYLIE